MQDLCPLTSVRFTLARVVSFAFGKTVEWGWTSWVMFFFFFSIFFVIICKCSIFCVSLGDRDKEIIIIISNRKGYIVMPRDEMFSRFTPEIKEIEQKTKAKMSHVNSEGGLHGIAEKLLVEVSEKAWEATEDIKTVAFVRAIVRLLFEMRGIPGFSKEKLNKEVAGLVSDDDIARMSEAIFYVYSSDRSTENSLYNIIKEVLNDDPLLSKAVPDNKLVEIKQILLDIYGADDVNIMIREIGFIVQAFKFGLSQERADKLALAKKNHRKDYVLISYPDSIIDSTGEKKPLQALKKFLSRTRMGMVHILPFYPWDADRGFSVENYGKVDPASGSWQDIDQINKDVDIMFDFVKNHASINNRLIQDALIHRHLPEDDPLYKRSYDDHKDYVIAYTHEQSMDLERKGAFSNVVRPRNHELLTEYHIIKVVYCDGKIKKAMVKAFLGQYLKWKYRVVKKKNNKMDIIIEGSSEGKRSDIAVKIMPEEEILLGGGKVWTTFSREEVEGIEETRQVDLNYRNPNVFAEAVIIALAYLERGAAVLRLDAIGYLWKEIGSTCIHEKKTHRIIQAMQAILKEAAPGVITVAEVNEPQEEAFKYIGDNDRPGTDMAYQFVHFPLAVYSILTGDAGYYRRWIDTIIEYGAKQFVLVYGSHDGMGLKPIMNILPKNELARMEIMLISKYGAKPNKARLSNNEEITYEICATPWNLINNPNVKEDIALQIKRYITVAMLGMAHRALRAFYINSYIGAPNFAGFLDENRTINRERFEEDMLFSELDDPESHKGIIMQILNTIIGKCTHQAAFDPAGPAIRTLETNNNAIIAEVLETPDHSDEEKIVQLINVSDQKASISLPIGRELKGKRLFEVFSGKGKTYEIEEGILKIDLEPYDVLWIKGKEE